MALHNAAMVVAGTLGFCAVTAFGVAPLTQQPLSPAQLIHETLGPLLRSTPHSIDSIDPVSFRRSEQVLRGDTFGSVAARLGINDLALFDFLRDNHAARELLAPRAGRQISAATDASGLVWRVEYTLQQPDADTNGEQLIITRDPHSKQLLARTVPIRASRNVYSKSVEVQTSLFTATDDAGIPDAITTQIADILSHEIDLHRNLRRGAKFRVAYEMIQREDSVDPPIPGRVRAVELINGRKVYQALWLQRGNGVGEYFTFNGRQLRNGFLRAPLEYTKITSGFSESRVHPVMQDMRAHKGIDYAAPPGTPVKTVGDGTIEFAGEQRGYGKVVIVAHYNDYSTLYAHLDEIAPNVVTGANVRQGDVIGEVGSTGWATGPHLHFEFRIAGEHADPQSAEMPVAVVLDPAERARFNAALAQVKHQFDLSATQRVARFD
jgi:murein DD-endopeptidase MepM/ murein hydrolase activator NlpD